MVNIGLFFDCHNTLMNSNEAWILGFIDCIGPDCQLLVREHLYSRKKRRLLAESYGVEFDLVASAARKHLLVNKKLISLISEWREGGGRTFLISNSGGERLYDDIEATQISSYFDEIYSGNDGGKKNLGIFDSIIDRYGLSLGVFIGNEEFDDHIEHPRIISMVITDFLRLRHTSLSCKCITV